MGTLIIVRSVSLPRRHPFQIEKVNGWAAASVLFANRFAECASLLFPFLFLFAPSMLAQERPTEIQVKAAYLYNFGKYVTWPAKPSANSNVLEICVLGKNPFGTVLSQTVDGESINGRKIATKALDDIQGGSECNILFVSASEEKRLRPILSAAQRLEMLTVSDIPHFAQNGGIVEFVIQDNRVRFEVNLGAAEHSHLILSSQLLKVASKIIDSGLPASQP